MLLVALLGWETNHHANCARWRPSFPICIDLRAPQHILRTWATAAASSSTKMNLIGIMLWVTVAVCYS